MDRFKKIAVMPIDGRYGLTEGAPKLGITPKEEKWLRKVTGVVACKDKDGNLRGGSATLFERNDQIVTSAHNLLNNPGRRTDCFFQTRSEPAIRRALTLGAKSTVFGTEDTDDNPNFDLVSAKLEKPIKGVEPVKRAKRIASLNTNDTVLMVSAQMLRMKRPLKGDEPVVQSCTIKNLMPLDERSGTSVYTDCSATLTASGSMSFVRDSDNSLAGIGILQGSAAEDQDDQPYSFSKRNIARNLIFDGPVADVLDQAVGNK